MMRKDIVFAGFVWFGDNSGKTTCKEYYEQHTLEYIHEHMTFENYKELLETAKEVK